MKVKVAIVNAFVDNNSGGNPAGVVLDADALTSEQKLAVAKAVGVSETAFVSRSTTADFKLDFFTPQRQIAHCGHATIATFSLLSQRGAITTRDTSKETIDGNRDIEVIGDFAYMGQTAPQYEEVKEFTKVYEAVGVDQRNVIAPPEIVNTGNGFMILGVDSIETLADLKPNLADIESISEQYDLIGFYVFTRETNQDNRDASTRMFAPRYGIEEESATGMAAGPLACFLHDRLQLNKATFLIEQGYAMTLPSPGCIEVVLNRDENGIQGLKAGGVGVTAALLNIDI